jgi:hypothetical protein
MSQCDFFVFPKLKTALKGFHFESFAEQCDESRILNVYRNSIIGMCVSCQKATTGILHQRQFSICILFCQRRYLVVCTRGFKFVSTRKRSVVSAPRDPHLMGQGFNGTRNNYHCCALFCDTFLYFLFDVPILFIFVFSEGTCNMVRLWWVLTKTMGPLFSDFPYDFRSAIHDVLLDVSIVVARICCTFNMSFYLHETLCKLKGEWIPLSD